MVREWIEWSSSRVEYSGRFWDEPVPKKEKDSGEFTPFVQREFRLVVGCHCPLRRRCSPTATAHACCNYLPDCTSPLQATPLHAKPRGPSACRSASLLISPCCTSAHIPRLAPAKAALLLRELGSAGPQEGAVAGGGEQRPSGR